MGFEEFGWLPNPSKGTNCPNYTQAIIKTATGLDGLFFIENSYSNQHTFFAMGEICSSYLRDENIPSHCGLLFMVLFCYNGTEFESMMNY